jgi:hypothetical protein
MRRGGDETNFSRRTRGRDSSRRRRRGRLEKEAARGVAPVLRAGHRIRERRSLSLVVFTVFMIRKKVRTRRTRSDASGREEGGLRGRRGGARREHTRVIHYICSERDWRTLGSFRATRRVVFVAMTHRMYSLLLPYAYASRFFFHEKLFVRRFGSRVDSRVSYGVGYLSSTLRASRRALRDARLVSFFF